MFVTHHRTMGFFESKLFGLSSRAKAFMSGLLFAAICFGLNFVDTGYTTTRVVESTVIAKTHGASNTRSGAAPFFILAVRHPDGTSHDISTSFATYSQVEKGSQLKVSVSDWSLGYDMPLVTKLLLAGIVLSGVIGIFSFFWVLLAW